MGRSKGLSFKLLPQEIGEAESFSFGVVENLKFTASKLKEDNKARGANRRPA